MLELDAWLAPLEPVMHDSTDAAVISSLQILLSSEPPELLMMMHGEKELPEALRTWLG